MCGAMVCSCDGGERGGGLLGCVICGCGVPDGVLRGVGAEKCGVARCGALLCGAVVCGPLGCGPIVCSGAATSTPFVSGGGGDQKFNVTFFVAWYSFLDVNIVHGKFYYYVKC